MFKTILKNLSRSAILIATVGGTYYSYKKLFPHSNFGLELPFNTNEYSKSLDRPRPRRKLDSKEIHLRAVLSLQKQVEEKVEKLGNAHIDLAPLYERIGHLKFKEGRIQRGSPKLHQSA